MKTRTSWKGEFGGRYRH